MVMFTASAKGRSEEVKSECKNMDITAKVRNQP
jgi:hypothetical protein